MEALLQSEAVSVLENLQNAKGKPTAEPSAKPLVLVVDDEPLSLKWVTKLLKPRGYEVICAEGGA